MNQPEPSQISAFSKIVSILIVIIFVVITTALIAGGYVYWCQKSVAEKEKNKLQQQIVKLQNEIRILKSNLVVNSNPKPILKNNAKPNKVKKEQDFLSGLERKIILILKQGDLAEVANFVHPTKGLRLSPYPFVDLQNDLVFQRIELAKLIKNRKKFVWGYQEETGMPLKLTPLDYYQHYIYDTDYEYAQEINYYQKESLKFTTSNCFEVYPKSFIVEFRAYDVNSKDNQGNNNWRSIRLVFEESENVWYLVGIIHDRWQI